MDRIESVGGVLEAIKSGWIQREIQESAYQQQRKMETGEKVVVGVNKYVLRGERAINILKIDENVEKLQSERLRKLKAERDSAKVSEALARLRRAFENPNENSMPAILEAVKAYATLGEIMDAGRDVFGSWPEPVII